MRQTSRDAVTAFRLMKGGFGQKLPLLAADCRVLKAGRDRQWDDLLENQEEYDSIAALAEHAGVAKKALQELLDALALENHEALDASSSLWEEISLKVMDIYFLCKTHTGIGRLAAELRPSAQEQDVEEKELLRFLKSRFNVLNQEGLVLTQRVRREERENTEALTVH